ncbi:MAG: type IX secretion system sortase PorU [Prevotella sp.]|jgi:hypothetical protein
MKLLHQYILLFVLLCLSTAAQAQRFFNLTQREVRVDSVLPHFSYSVPLPGNYNDSTFTASILYPEFIDMTMGDVVNYHRLSDEQLPVLPVIDQQVVVDRKKGALEVQFCPLVYRDGRYQILVSFMLRVDSKAKSRGIRRANARTRATASDRYADHSVLASGNWAKIRVPSTGVYQLTETLIRKAGFSDLSKVKVYGYGGNLQNETLDADELSATDDLQEVALCKVNGRLLFYAKGPVSWSNNTAARRTRNPYSDYGYYFITQGDEETTTVDSTTFVDSFYPSADDYHTLYEVDGYSWYHGGRNLFDTQTTASGETRTIVLKNPTAATSGQLSVSVTAGSNSQIRISLNDSTLGERNITLGSYDVANSTTGTYSVDGLVASDSVRIEVLSGGPARLDYVSMAWDEPQPAPTLSATTSVPEYVCNITNQDHHADSQADMVIIIPTSQELLEQAERLATYHESHDGLRVNIVPADELFNEFSSGTPDANAYRRYLKMLYDRAESEDDMPRWLLLMGGGVWDNRMLTTDCQNLSPDDYLLCFEGENSFNEINCYVDDGFFGLLDDGEGSNPLTKDKLDVAIGRFPVTTADEAKVMVDKVINYGNNENAGAWQNTLMFMGDDGNNNLHMNDANSIADSVISNYPGYVVKKVMWDAYNEVSTSTGNSYPDARSTILAQQEAGALIMSYTGHGAAYQISHERVLELNDFKNFTNENLPLWIVAGCDIMPFDKTEENIGVSAVTNANGGALAFFGATRTVYANYNKMLSSAFVKYVLSLEDDKPITIGEAQRLAKNQMIDNRQDLTVNKLQYAILGDPALSLCLPVRSVVIDSINGQAVTSTNRQQLKAGQKVSIDGHVADESSDGLVTLTVRDSRELVTCKMNTSAEADTAFTYYDRTRYLFQGTDSVKQGKFSMQFTVPVDINYTNETGLINVYAVDETRQIVAHGADDNFTVGGTDITANDSTGPKIYCYLNSTEFQDGGTVNTTPYFVAQISDSDGINVTGSSAGHNLQLIVDNDPSMTYNLNDNFQYDFGSYTSGSTWYSLPEMEPGSHQLVFRAWDVLNHSSSTTLNFNVVRGLTPTLYSVDLTENPATEQTTFIVSHSFTGSSVDVCIEVFNTAGNLLWKHTDSGVTSTTAYTYTWDLCTEGGGRLPTGVYLYRVRLSSEGSQEASTAKKFVVIGNN